MATFNELNPTTNYQIINGENGYSLTDSIQGADAMTTDWPDDAEAWPQGETEYKGKPVEVAQ